MKLNNLQILRGISALLVCFFHFSDILDSPDLELGKILFANGGIGVPIFFVISGFIMVYTTRKITDKNPKKNVKDFLIKRIIRIVPLYFLLTVAWMVIGRDVMHYFSPEIFPRTWHSFLFLPYSEAPPVLFQGWSLNYEMFFYLIFAVSFFLKNKRYFFVLSFFAAAITVGQFFHPKNAVLAMIFAFVNIHFLIGVLIGLTIEQVKMKKTTAVILFWLSNLVFWMIFFGILPVPPLLNALIVGFLVFGFLLLDRFTPNKSSRFLVMLGDISYSIYLVHPFIQVILRRFQTESIYLNLALFLAEIILVIIVSKILYEIIEKKFTEFLKKKLI